LAPEGSILVVNNRKKTFIGFRYRIRLIYARTTLVNVLLICIEIGIKSKKKLSREKWRFGRIYDDIGVKF